jgi:D-alanyl-D-alanine carboxypeptidase/D-alanyl-D-alanine-endopeptidase (penicillin-binding protein 4)
VPTLAVLLVLAAAVVSWRVGAPADGGDTGPASVPPPPGLSLRAPAAASPVATPARAGDLAAARVRGALGPALHDKDLGGHVRALVAPLDRGAAPVFSSGQGVARPASTMKLLTTTAALDVLGPEHTFTTKVVDAARGRVVLVGGGDPYLASKPADSAAYPPRADVRTLARETAAALLRDGRSRVRLGYDASLFTGPAVNPLWPADYVPGGEVAPTTALWVDEGRLTGRLGRADDPARVAADAFASALRKAGVAVLGRPRPGTAPGGAHELAAVHSAPLAEIVEETLTVSDNDAAEVLAHQVGLAVAGSGSFRGGADAVERTLTRLGVPLDGARIHDGSGLARQDRLDPRTLLAVLQLAADPDHPELRAVVTGLPVAGFTGSLDDRFDQSDPQALGRVRAKTGTLSGTSALAGIATDRDGDPMVFALMTDRVAPADTLGARAALDDLAASLAACRCGR